MELMRALLALCLCIIPAGLALPQFSIFIPSLLKSNEIEKLCLTAKHHNEIMDVLVLYEVDNTNYTIVNEQLPPGDNVKTYTFPVPDVKAATPVFLSVYVVSGNYSYTARRSVVIAPMDNVLLIQTDKNTYKGGQKVQINVMSVDNNLRPVDEMISVIYIKDPSGNRLAQWLNQKTNGNFLLLIFILPNDPAFGSYSIVAERQSGKTVRKDFSADSYVVPKFSVTLKAPDMVTILDKTMSFEARARYTYDQAVPGKVSGRVCRPPVNFFPGNTCNRNPDGVCVLFTGETDFEGTFKGSVDLSRLDLDRSGYSMVLNLQLTVTEQGTDVQVTETKTISITSQMGRAYFDYNAMRLYFKKGLPYSVKVTFENGVGLPDVDQVVELQVDGKPVANLTSDKHGKAGYEVDTSEMTTGGFQLQLVYKNQEQCNDPNWIVPTYITDSRYVTRFFSQSHSFVELQDPREELQCGKTYQIQVRYIFGKEALPKGETTIKFVCVIMARAKIVEVGQHTVDVSQSLQGEFNLSYTPSPDQVPIGQLVVQYMLPDEVVADALNLNLEKCFENQVSANFSSAEGMPGSSVDLNVYATSQSICLYHGFDSALLLLDQGQISLTPAMVFDSLSYMSLNGYDVEGFNVAPASPACIDSNKQILFNGIYWQPVTFPEEEDTSKVFSSVGIQFITATPFQQPQLCSQPFFGAPIRRPTIFAEESDSLFASPMATTSVSANVQEIKTVRTEFPEVWFWGTTQVGESGFTSVPLDVPGTITTWKSDVLCLSNKTGFGMTKELANFTAFMKMFVNINMPDSIVNGENMRLVATVANYMTKTAKVQVTLQPGSYSAELLDESSIKCVPPQERAVFSWNISNTSIGLANVTVTAQTLIIGESCDGPADPNEPNRSDTVVQSFTVEPEGIKQETTQTDFVCVKDTNSVVRVNINPSGNIVPGSLSAKFQVIGEMLGRALSHPEALITEPTGCGEQNLVTLMPIVSAVEFLNLTDRLTEQTEQRAKLYLAAGYVRQMYYRHANGGFSAFGPGRSEPSGWLTLLTLQTLWDMRHLTFIDDNIFQQGLIFLERLQDPSTGRFKPVGTLFNSGLKGGADDDVGFTCAVVSFLAKTTYAATPSLLRTSLAYLDAASRKDQSVYNIAMLFSVFRETGNVERANAMYETLNSLAIDADGTRHWERPIRPVQQAPLIFYAQAPSAELQITATVLKALTDGEERSTVSSEKLNVMAQIVNWLVKYQTIHGCYSTTSDTVAVLEGLCAYGVLVYQPNATNTVVLKQGNQVIREFNVGQPNRILLQMQDLAPVPGQYSIEVSGNGCVLLQTGVAYNVPVKKENSAFSLSLITFPEDCKNGVAYSVNIQVNASYHGMQNQSNMVLVEIPFPSGYSMNQENLQKLKAKFPRVDAQQSLVIYMNDVPNGGDISFKVKLDMGSRVDNFQPRSATIVDYYEKDENGAAVLYHPCTLANVKKHA